jgi:membrane protease YdiL (CAAX protease family)
MIGAGLRGHPVRLTLVAAAGAEATYSMFVPLPTSGGVFVVAALLAVAMVASPDPAGTLGLRARPSPSLRYWVVGTLAIGAIVGVVCTIYGLVMYWTGNLDLDQPPRYQSVDDFGRVLWYGCVRAPVLEETVFRLLLCAPLVAAGGRWVAIVASGALFAYYHVHWGVPGPDNMTAGFLFAWAYLRSNSLLVPIVLHALGNLVVGVFDLIHFLHVT